MSLNFGFFICKMKLLCRSLRVISQLWGPLSSLSCPDSRSRGLWKGSSFLYSNHGKFETIVDWHYFFFVPKIEDKWSIDSWCLPRVWDERWWLMGKVAAILAEDSTVLAEIHRADWLDTGEPWAFMAFIFLVSWANAQAFQTVNKVLAH